MKYLFIDDGLRYWPREGRTMLAYSVADARVYDTQEAAEQAVQSIHARNPKSPFPWRVIPIEPSTLAASRGQTTRYHV